VQSEEWRRHRRHKEDFPHFERRNRIRSQRQFGLDHGRERVLGIPTERAAILKRISEVARNGVTNRGLVTSISDPARGSDSAILSGSRPTVAVGRRRSLDAQLTGFNGTVSEEAFTMQC
jgi:hypothetical protein